MSCFLVGERCMECVVGALLPPGRRMEEADNLGRELFKLNVQAYRLRYAERADQYTAGLNEYGQTWAFKNKQDVTELEQIKALNCLIYQCAEGRPVEETELYRRMERVRDDLCRRFISQLPAYDGLPWGD